MADLQPQFTNFAQPKNPANNILDKLPLEVKQWAESLPWNQRRYVLSLSYILCASSPQKQAEFLDDYIADGLVSKMLEDVDTINRVKQYLFVFRIQTELNESVIRDYIRQFYIHSAQDTHRQPDLYLESALHLVANTEERNNVFYYILGIEFIKIMFKMSWLQQERLARLQKNQEIFINNYVKPIQTAHRLNNLVVPKDEKIFFARRAYYIKVPDISSRKLIELVMATFTTDKVSNCGFAIMRHVESFRFDYEYIFNSAPDDIFPPEFQSMPN
jgi:hypothetical protein